MTHPRKIKIVNVHNNHFTIKEISIYNSNPRAINFRFATEDEIRKYSEEFPGDYV